MHFSQIILAVLPALALAQDSAAPTSSQPAQRTKTITLSRAHATASLAAPGGAAAATGASAHTTAPTASPVPISGGAGLEAGKVALAGVAGMIVVALM